MHDVVSSVNLADRFNQQVEVVAMICRQLEALILDLGYDSFNLLHPLWGEYRRHPFGVWSCVPWKLV